MQQFPHHYTVSAIANADGEARLESSRLPPLATAPPAEFGGPGDQWSPETFCVGAVADCFVLTFRAIARAAKLRWSALRCDVEGTLDRVEGVTQFTSFALRANLQLPPGADAAQARALLERTEHTCLISRSLKGTSRLEAIVETAERRAGAA
jgi:organic hydroperoxide reductase OsmC/OhrA